MTDWTWVEPFAGAAACALRLVGGRDLTPPVAWMGGKRRLARAILDAMGVPAGPPSSVLLADAGPWGWVWPLLLAPEGAAAVARVLRSWAGEHPRDLWQRLAAQPPAEDLHERAAQWLWLQARSASGVPIWWDGWRSAEGTRWEAPNGRGTTSRPGFNTGQAARDRGDDLRWPGHQAERARWEKGTPAGRPPQDATNGQRSSDSPSATSGLLDPCTIASRAEAIAAAFARVDVDVHHGQARDILPRSGEVEGITYPASAPRTWVYLDPPYVGATGYGWDLPRAEVLALARRWADAGAVVAVSEAEPLDLPGWHVLDLTRPGGKPEWLTLSRAPARLPERQADLFDAAPPGEPTPAPVDEPSSTRQRSG